MSGHETTDKPGGTAIDEPQVILDASDASRGPEPRKGTAITVAGVLVIALVTAGLSVVISNARRVEPSPLDFTAASSIRTMRMVMTTEGDSPDGETFMMTMEMAFDFERDLGRIISRFEGQPEFSTEMIFTETHFLMKVPRLLGAQFSSEGKAWTRAPLDAETLAAFRRTTNLVGVSDDPRTFFEGLSTMATDVTEDGKETVNGVATTRYRMTIDAEQFVRQVGGLSDEEVAEALQEFADEPITARIWIGEDGLPYRQTFEMTVQEAPVSMTVDYLDYNEPVRIELPAESEIEDVESPFGRSASCTFSETGRFIDDGSGTSQPQPSPSVSCSPSP